MNCVRCDKTIVKPTDSVTTGYGIDSEGNKICFACCAEADKHHMRENGRITLYFSPGDRGGRGKVSNWPGSLVWENVHYTIGGHNWGLKRYDCWFWFENCEWHGVRYGDNTELLHCKQTNNRRSIQGQSTAQLIA